MTYECVRVSQNYRINLKVLHCNKVRLLDREKGLAVIFLENRAEITAAIVKYSILCHIHRAKTAGKVNEVPTHVKYIPRDDLHGGTVCGGGSLFLPNISIIHELSIELYVAIMR